MLGSLEGDAGAVFWAFERRRGRGFGGVGGAGGVEIGLDVALAGLGHLAGQGDDDLLVGLAASDDFEGVAELAGQLAEGEAAGGEDEKDQRGELEEAVEPADEAVELVVVENA